MITKFQLFEGLDPNDPYNEENWDDIKTPCQHCHNEEGTYCVNPYILEIKGRRQWEYICDSCYYWLCQDI